MLKGVCLVVLCLYCIQWTEACSRTQPSPPPGPFDYVTSGCQVQKNYRYDCGWPGINFETCNSRGCCFHTYWTDAYNCYYHKNTWSSWGGWGACNKKCGTGSQYRYRSCLAANSCSGSRSDHRYCNTQKCPREWSNWSGWSRCTATCGQGIKQRTRTCSDGSGPICDGGATQIISCNYKTVCSDSQLGAVRPGKETLKSLAKLSKTRPQLISTLHKVAAELRKEQHLANVHHIISSGTAVVGYALMGLSVMSEAVTVGADTPLAVPLFTLGEVMASGGTMASVITSIVDDLKKSSTLKEAESVFDKDFKLSNNVKDWTDKMESVAQSTNASIVSAGITSEFSMNVFRPSVLALVTSNTKEVLISAEKLPMVVETVTTKLAGAAFSIWDLLVSTIHVAKGSPSEAANKIDEIANNMEGENNDLQKKLQQLSEKLLEEIKYSLENEATNTPQRIEAALNMLNTIYNWNQEWIDIFNNLNSGMTLEEFIITVLQPYFNEIGKKIEQQKNSGSQSSSMDVGIIAHGSIGSSLSSPNPWETNVASSTPVALHFATQSLRSITFYQPWGSMLHANAAYRILTTSIRPQDRNFYEGDEYQNDPLELGDNLMEGLEGLPSYFNRITSETGGWIPTTWLNPTPDNDPVLQQLSSLLTRFPAQVMFSVSYPAPVAVPAFVVTDAVALVGSLFHIEMNVHIVACLGLGSNVNTGTLNTNQYYSVVQLLGSYSKIWMATGNAAHP